MQDECSVENSYRKAVKTGRRGQVQVMATRLDVQQHQLLSHLHSKASVACLRCRGLMLALLHRRPDSCIAYACTVEQIIAVRAAGHWVCCLAKLTRVIGCNCQTLAMYQIWQQSPDRGKQAHTCTAVQIQQTLNNIVAWQLAYSEGSC